MVVDEGVHGGVEVVKLHVLPAYCPHDPHVIEVQEVFEAVAEKKEHALETGQVPIKGQMHHTVEVRPASWISAARVPTFQDARLDAAAAPKADGVDAAACRPARTPRQAATRRAAVGDVQGGEPQLHNSVERKDPHIPAVVLHIPPECLAQLPVQSCLSGLARNDHPASWVDAHVEVASSRTNTANVLDGLALEHVPAVRDEDAVLLGHGHAGGAGGLDLHADLLLQALAAEAVALGAGHGDAVPARELADGALLGDLGEVVVHRRQGLAVLQDGRLAVQLVGRRAIDSLEVFVLLVDDLDVFSTRRNRPAARRQLHHVYSLLPLLRKKGTEVAASSWHLHVLACASCS
mmetsp:Transcript_53991/g.157608  ORF Transcript_53991/g.157608 Transcript_53991/m.157608 type:complete len:349 (+) Transcript_53991:1299-2345(+)